MAWSKADPILMLSTPTHARHQENYYNLTRQEYESPRTTQLLTEKRALPKQPISCWLNFSKRIVSVALMNAGEKGGRQKLGLESRNTTSF
jgi:hypothetical protein